MTQRFTLLSRVFMLLLASPLAITALFESGIISKQPLLLALLGVTVILCFFGSRLESHNSVNYISRVVLLIVTLTVGLIAMEIMVLGNGTQRVVGLLLLPLSIVGIKYVLSLQYQYWIVFVISTVAMLAVYMGLYFVIS